MARFRSILIRLIAMTAMVPCVRAHTPSETRLTFFITGATVTGQWEVAMTDLQHGLRLEPAALAALSAEEQERRLEALAIDTITRLEVKVDGQVLAFRVTDLETVTLNAGDFARVQFAAAVTGAAPAQLEVNARSLFGVDTNMHGLLRVEHDGRTDVASFNAATPAWTLPLAGPPDRWSQLGSFVRKGVWHIWMGFDHILFLLALLLPSVLRREGRGWTGEDRFRTALVRIVKIVTAFTLAHSITLSLATLDVVQVTPRVVEPLIAASVIAAAVNNLRPWFGERGWMVAFGFGLMHGFGFASGLLEGGLRDTSLALALVGFNVGVELAQLAIVAVFLPVAFALRGTSFYRLGVCRWGSAAVVFVAAVWLVERVFNFTLVRF